MNWPGPSCLQTRRFNMPRRGGFTLIEVLVAVTLTLVMMAAVVEIFAIVGKSISNSRATLEMSERIRAVASRLKLDLQGVTADMTPPGRPEEGKGYFEYIEGPIGPVAGLTAGFNTDEGGVDTTVGDRDDILQFTTRSRGEPFVGRGLVIGNLGTLWGNDMIGPGARYTAVAKSQVAEVSWFLRGTTLYRRVLLVSPSFDADIRTASPDPREAEVPFKAVYAQSYQSDVRRLMGYYNNYDLSVHWDANANRVGITGGVPDLSGPAGRVVCNTLADLTRRECRYAHPPLLLDGVTSAFPHALHHYNPEWRKLGLPTLQESSHAAWPFPINGLMPYYLSGGNGYSAVILTNPSGAQFDAWVDAYPFDEIDKDTGSVNLNTTSTANPPQNPPVPFGSPSFLSAVDSPRYVGPRVAEDVILTNVLSFDVKAWDPGAPVLLTVGNVSLIPGDFNYPTALAMYTGGGAGAPLLASRGAYVDLGFSPALNPSSDFSGIDYYAQLRVNAGVSINAAGDSETAATVPRMYDSWSIHYEHDGVDQFSDGTIDLGTNGFDDDADGVVDEADEQEAPAPYAAPLRGIQIKIRVFEPDSQQVREVTIRHDFLGK